MSKPWPKVRLGQVLRSVARAEPVDPTKSYRLLGIRLDGNGPFLRESVSGTQTAATKLFRVEAGDFIYSRLFACRGAFGLIEQDLHDCYVSGEFPTFTAVETEIDLRFLRYWFRLPSVIRKVDEDCTGSTPLTRNRYKENFFLDLEIPRPALDEQKRIVAYLDALSAKITQARTLRHQSIQEAAAIVASEANSLFGGAALHRWPSNPLGEVADIRSGVTLGRTLNGPVVRLPYLRVANVQDGHLDLGEMKEVEVLESEAGKWKLQNGDLLLTEGGDWDKLGRGTVWREEIANCIHQNHIFRVRVGLNDFVPEFVAKLISSPLGKAYFQEASKQTTNLASINQRQLKAFRIFKPPLPEQRRIVTELDALQTKVDALKQLQADTEAELTALQSAALDRAFKGEL